MTDLLSPPRRTSPTSPTPPGPRAPAVAAVVGGLVAAGTVLAMSVAVALAGWFAADAGRYGDTRDATRVGVDAWLLAHGSGVTLGVTSVTVIPLGWTLVAAWAARAVGRRVAASAGLGDAPEHLRPVLTAAGVMATVYALVAMLASVLSTHPRAETGLLRALVGGFVLCLVAGGAGLLSGSGQARSLAARLPTWVRGVLTGAASVVLLVVAGASVLVTAALLLDFGTAATVLSRLHADGPAGLSYTVVGLLFVPNAVLLGTAYLLGPGFAVGVGTVVSPTVVVLGPLPSFPLLAALPAAGATPDWGAALVGVPVVLALVGVALAGRLAAPGRLDAAALQGLGAGLVAALALSGLVWLAGGSAGPGRMAEVGAQLPATLLAAAVSFGGGGLVGGALGGWLSRRRTPTA